MIQNLINPMKFSQIVENLQKLIEASSLTDFPNLDPDIAGISQLQTIKPL
jgi:hypothetical protein